MMKKFTKIALIIALVCFVIGSACISLGVNMGANVFQYPNLHLIHSLSLAGLDIDQAIAELYEEGTIDYTVRELYSGEKIESIQVSLDAGRLEVLAGETFSVKTVGISGDRITHSLKGGHLEISSEINDLENFDFEDDWDWDEGYDIDLSKKFWISQNGELIKNLSLLDVLRYFETWENSFWGEEDSKSFRGVIITIPEGEMLESLSIQSNASYIKLSQLNTESFSGKMAASKIQIQGLKALKSTILLRACETKASGVELEDLWISNIAGDLKLSGVLSGNIRISNNSGDSEYLIQGQLDDYFIIVDNYGGKTTLNNRNFNQGGSGGYSSANQIEVKNTFGKTDFKISP